MSIIRVTKIFPFEMAHALWKHDGKCENIHGHSYQLHVTVKGETLSHKLHSKDGMVMDFHELKKIVEAAVIREFDHALVVSSATDKTYLYQLSRYNKKLFIVPYQPTCENLLLDFAQRIQTLLPLHFHLHRLQLQETPTSYAAWYAEDNE